MGPFVLSVPEADTELSNYTWTLEFVKLENCSSATEHSFFLIGEL